MSTACQLLVPAIYPQGKCVCVCVCVCIARAVGTWRSSTRSVVGRWLLREELRLPRTRGNRSPFAPLLFLPVIVFFFFLPPSMFQTSLFPTPILFCASFEPSLAKFDPHLMELQTKIKKSFVGSQLQWTWMPGFSSLVWLLLLLLFTVRTVRFVISEREDFSIDLYTYIYIYIYRWFENGRKFGGEWRRVWRQSREEAQELGDLRRQIWGRCWSAGESWQLFQIGQIV
jgi:hypothetical protein